MKSLHKNSRFWALILGQYKTVFFLYKQKYVYRYQRDNQMPEIEGHTMQCPKAKGQIMIYKTLGRKLKIEQD
jgi:hypothetical protein